MARAGRKASAADLVRSLAVILVPLVIITVFFTRDLDDHPVTVVEVSPALAVARQQAPYPVLAPVNLPTEWRPIKADWVPAGRPALNGEPSPRNAWSLGYLNPEDTYIELKQGDRGADDLISKATREGVPDGTSTVDATTWERRLSPDGRTRALVLRSPSVTTVVAGDLPYEALEAFAAALRDR